LAGLAVVAAAAGVGPAALLLGAGAVLAASLDGRLGALCGLPGAVVLADALVSRPATGIDVAAALALAVTGLALAARFGADVRLDGGRPLALALAAWLVVAPGSWAFTGADGLGAYDTGTAQALATGALVALAVLFRRGGEFSAPAVGAAGSDDRRGEDDPLARRPLLTAGAATVATVGSVGWLVVSVLRLH
jgi:hypothetical protein